jgi:endonuclease/exonuclease/phosphatase family metal-dependent hydrolase
VLRVMSWNVWWRFGPWAERQPAIIDTIIAEAPDVLCLQEVWSDGETSLAGIVAERLGYHVALSDNSRTRRGDIGFHNAVVSRWPITAIDSRPLPDSTGADGHRRALLVDLQTPWGAWPVVSTHLAYRFDESALRTAQVQTLQRLVADRRGDPDHDLPTILCGDLNAVPDSDEIRLLTGRRPGPPNLVFSDCWEQAGDGPGHTWRVDNPYQADTAWPNRRLDYVLVSWPRPKPVGNPRRAWLAGVAPIGGVTPSDHAAVVAELTVPSP